MAPRSRYASSEVSDHYEERSTRTGRGARDKRYYEEEEVIRERRPPPPRERETLIKEEVRSRDRPRSPPSDHFREDIRIRERARSPPDQFREDIRIRERAKSPTSYVREDIKIKERPRTPPEYVREDIRIRERERPRTPPGYVREEYVRAQPILRGRVREDFEFAPRPPPPRSPTPSPPPPPRVEREEIIIGGRREPEVRREPPPRDFEREEIIIGGRREPELRREPPPPRDFEREEIIIGGRREPELRREPPPPRDFEREEIIIRNNDREPPRRPPPRERDFEREELIIRDGPSSTRSVKGTEYERDEYISRRGAPRDRSVESRFDRGPPPRGPDYDREEVIIRRDREDRGGPRRRSPSLERGFDREEVIIRRDDRGPPPPPTMTRVASPPRSRYYDDFEEEPPRPIGADALALTRVRSHERARSVSRHPENDNREIIIRRDRDDRESRRGGSREREREEIIIRRNERERDRSSSPTSTIAAPMGLPEPPMIRAPAIHQEVITHHRHIDHGYEVVAPAPRPITRPPSPPSPPPREERDETIEIHRRGERNGRPYDEDIIISDRDRERSHTPLPPPARREYAPTPPAPVEPYRPPYAESPRRPYMDPRDERDIREEAEYYNNRATERGYPGEGHHGATRDWAIVDVPPGTRRVRMDGVGGGAQEVTWQRYNGVRRSKFMPDGGSDEGYGSAEAGPLALVPSAGAGGAQLGRRYEGVRDKKDALWTEITKDLVVREAIEEAGYEFEETDDFYYVIAYLRYEDIARLVGLSEDIRHARRRRIKEMGWERRSHIPPSDKRSSSGAMLIEEEKRPLMIEGPPRSEKGSEKWDREDEFYREREVTVGRGPPPRRGW